jgi:hypothetical protein
MTDRVAEVQHLPAPGVALVLGHHGELRARAADDRLEVRVAALAHPRPQRAPRDQRRLDHLGMARGQLGGGQRGERVRVADHGRGLVVGAGVVLALGQVHPGLAAVGGVHLGHERRRNLHVAHPALVDRRAEAGQVAHDAAADGHDQVAALGARAGEPPQHLLGGRQRLALLAGRHDQRLLPRHRVPRRDVLVRDDEAAALARVREAGGDQARAEEDWVVARRRGGPDEPRARGRLCERADRRQRGADRVAARRRQHRVGHRRVERLAVAVELGEAAEVAGERAPAPGRAPPGVLRVHLEQDDRVSAERLAHPLGADRPAAERHDAAAGRVEQLEHDLLLTGAERVLALTVEERLDRLAQPPLELLVRIERLDAEQRRGGARRGGLPGAHEPHQHERALRRGAGRRLVWRYPRLQPIRSS